MADATPPDSDPEAGPGGEAEEPATVAEARHERRGPVGAAVGLARIGAAAWWRTTIWTAAASARVGSRVVRAASTGQAPAQVFRSTRSDLRSYARRVLGIIDPDELIRQAASEITTRNTTEAGTVTNGTPRPLRELGAELLRRSADVNFEEGTHPAYARILEDLAPDEGRILRLLAIGGPQPSVDIRSGWVPLNAATELVAAGLSMIGPESGCRHTEDVPAYLNNLFRLGLIWFSREPLSDPLRYQVLEAQPEVIEAMAEAGRARTVRRSIELTPFGKEFCRLCLPLEPDQRAALGGAEAPSALDRGQPDAGEERDG